MDESPLTFPKKADQARLANYLTYDNLYYGDHYEAFSVVGEKGFTNQYNKLRYVVANFAGLMSRVMADMLFGETIKVDMDKNQDFVDGFMETNAMITQLYESALANSRRGDSTFKLRIGQRNVTDIASDSTVILEEFSPETYFPEFDPANARYTPSKDVLAWVFKQNNVAYLRKEIHQPGYIFNEIYRYNETEKKIVSQEDVTAFGLLKVEETKIKRSLIFHIPNVRDGRGFFGTSDYYDLQSLFFALNNRITKVDNILDKHSDPILAVPPGVIDEDGKVNRSALGMFVVDNENPGFNKPEYIVWNANLDSAMKEIDTLVDMLFMFSEISPATMGRDNGSGGKAESGRALKFKLLRTIAKRNRKKIYYDQAIKDIIETAQELAAAHSIAINDVKVTASERPKIEWGDGIPLDSLEQINEEVERIDAGLSSRADSIARLDGITPEEAKKKVAEIDAEAAPKTIPGTEGIDPKTGLPITPAGGTPPPKPPTLVKPVSALI